jgi:hypothetical protein
MLADRLGLKAGISETDSEWASISGPIDLQDRLSRWVSSMIRPIVGLG